MGMESTWMSDQADKLHWQAVGYVEIKGKLCERLFGPWRPFGVLKIANIAFAREVITFLKGVCDHHVYYLDIFWDGDRPLIFVLFSWARVDLHAMCLISEDREQNMYLRVLVLRSVWAKNND